MKAFVWLASAVAAAALLAGCGGGGSGSTVTGPLASVLSIKTDQIVYRKNMQLTVTGQNLTKGITVFNFGCTGMTEVGTATDTQRVFTCKMIAVGTVVLKITAADNSTIYSGVLTIPAPAQQPQVTMATSMGTIVMQLDPTKAPISVDNFLDYVETNYYPNTIFHRVVSNFVIQGGGYTQSLTVPTTALFAPIVLESGNGLKNVRGSVAMARTDVLTSTTSQFFINTINNTSLDATNAGANGYAVFGTVTSGMDVVDKISAVPTSTQAGLANVPVTPILITAATEQ
ncbi:peptidylprolyl isomerase [Undibacterium sp.]|uniref:peptidylprolyl isomerase n=1 Tax=Undibacterium sp. TaxID=1914977 RepID=UPI00374D949F